MIQSIGQYSKFIVSILGTAAVAITTFGHNASWAPVVLSAISAISVYLVPNAAPPIAVKGEPVVVVHPTDGTMSPPVSNP